MSLLIYMIKKLNLPLASALSKRRARTEITNSSNSSVVISTLTAAIANNGGKRESGGGRESGWRGFRKEFGVVLRWP